MQLHSVPQSLSQAAESPSETNCIAVQAEKKDSRTSKKLAKQVRSPRQESIRTIRDNPFRSNVYRDIGDVELQSMQFSRLQRRGNPFDNFMTKAAAESVPCELMESLGAIGAETAEMPPGDVSLNYRQTACSVAV